MVKIRHLSRAPIVEALVDFRVHLAGELSAEELERRLTGQEFGYRKQGSIYHGRFGLVVNLQNAPLAQPLPASATAIGTRLQSSDGKYVAQLTTEGFTLSRLEPYETWDALMAEARRVWNHYRACVDPTRIHRTGTRFINNLRLPLKPGERFERFLTALPKMPPDYPQTISSFLQRFVVLDEPSGASGVLTQALDQFPSGPAAHPVPVILDIDVFRETQFAPDGPEVWRFLSELRDLKDRFFFGALTEQAVELYV